MRWGLLVVLASTVACHDGDGDEASSSNTCGLAGAGEDAPAEACCDDPCCNGGADGSFAPCDDGAMCTTNEECGPGLVCEGGVCTSPPANALVECETPPALATSTFGVGTFNQPGALASIDFEGDSGTDLLIGRNDGVVVWQHQGGSSFAEMGPFPASTFGRPRGVAVYPVDADDLPDVVVLAEGQPGSIGVLYRDLTQTFVAQPPITAGADPTKMLVADLDGDDANDLVLVSSGATGVNVIHVLLADGAGGFLVPLDVTLTQAPFDAAVAEVTGDDALDIVVANATGVAVLAGRGTGGFDEVAQLGAPTGALRGGVAVIDLDDDGAFELVRAAEVAGVGEIAIWTWSGTEGSAAPVTTYTTMLGLTALAVADLDADGRDDLVAAARSADAVTPIVSELVVLPTVGDMTLRCQARFPIAKPALALHVDDLDGDGALDVATASGEDTLTLLLSSG